MRDLTLAHTPQRCGLAENPALPADLLDRFVALACAELCADLADRPDLSRAQARILATRGGTDASVRLVRRGLLRAEDVDRRDPHIVLALLDEMEVPEEWIADLVTHPDPWVRTTLTSARFAPMDVLTRLAVDDDVEVVAAVAGSTAMTPGLAEMLAKHPHAEPRRALAGNEHTPPGFLAALAVDGGQPGAGHCFVCHGPSDRRAGGWCDGAHEGAVCDIQDAAVRNPATPAAAVIGLIDHPVVTVRWGLAARSDLPSDLYHRLATDPIPGVRGDVASNPAIDETLIRTMATDRTYDVQRRLAHNPSVPLDVLVDLATASRIGPTLLPRIAAATPEEVYELAASKVPAARMLVAQRPDLPATVIEQLAHDPDAKVLKSIAPNPRVSEQQLCTMVAQHGPRVIVSVARNPTCTPELLRHLAVHAPPVQKVYREIARQPNATDDVLALCLGDHQARRIAARHPALAPHTIVELLDDPDSGVAEAAAANPSLPRTAMKALLSNQR